MVTLYKADCREREVPRTLKLPPTGQVHDSLRVVLSLQLLENRQVLTVHAGQRGIVDRIVVVPRGVLVQRSSLLDDKAPETSSGLGDSSEVIRIVRRILPFEEYVHRGGSDSRVASRIGRVSRWELVMGEVVAEERFDVVREEYTILRSEGRSPVLYEFRKVYEHPK